MNTERIKEIQQETDYPESVSVQQALLKVWNETEQEQLRIAAVSGSLPDDKRIVTEAILAARKVDSDVGLLPSYQDIKMFCLGAKWMRDKILNK